MLMTPVDSTHIKAIGHDPASNTLAIEFHKGGVYHYHDVPADKHTAILNADSISAAFKSLVKGQHTHEKQYE
jgi:hypothetical protein